MCSILKADASFGGYLRSTPLLQAETDYSGEYMVSVCHSNTVGANASIWFPYLHSYVPVFSSSLSAWLPLYSSVRVWLKGNSQLESMFVCVISFHIFKSFTAFASLCFPKWISVFAPFFPSTLSPWRRHPLLVFRTWSSPKVKDRKLLECGWEENRLEIRRHFLFSPNTLL